MAAYALVPNLTALEQLQYVSELRSPHGTPAAVARARAEEVLEELRLQVRGYPARLARTSLALEHGAMTLLGPTTPHARSPPCLV